MGGLIVVRIRNPGKDAMIGIFRKQFIHASLQGPTRPQGKGSEGRVTDIGLIQGPQPRRKRRRGGAPTTKGTTKGLSFPNPCSPLLKHRVVRT